MAKHVFRNLTDVALTELRQKLQRMIFAVFLNVITNHTDAVKMDLLPKHPLRIVVVMSVLSGAVMMEFHPNCR